MKFELRRRIELNLGKVLALAYHPQRPQVAVGTRDGGLLVVDVTTGEVCERLKGHTDLVSAVAYREDGEFLLSAGKDRTLRLWQTSDYEFVRDLAGIITKPTERTLRGQMMTSSVQGHTQTPLSVAWGAGGYLGSGGQDCLVKLWRIDAPLRSFDWHGGPVTRVAFRPGTSELFSASRDGTIRSWRAETGAMIHKYLGHRDEIEDMAFLDDERFVSGDLHGRLLSWVVGQEEPDYEIITWPSAVRCLAASPDGGHVFAGVDSGEIVAFDRRKRRRKPAEPVFELEAHELAVRALVVSPDGKRLVSGGNDTTLRVFELQS